jgi:hypothetical protein
MVAPIFLEARAQPDSVRRDFLLAETILSSSLIMTPVKGITNEQLASLLFPLSSVNLLRK